MWYIEEDFRWQDFGLYVIALFVRAWVVMLALGGLGHQTHSNALFINFWTVFLLVLIARLLFGSAGVSKFKAARTRKELK